MPKFRVFIHGINFHMPSPQGPVTPVGFYVTAAVEADNDEAAELLAMDLLRASPSLADVRNPPGDPPRMFVEELEELDAWPPNVKIPLTGFVFYDDPEVDWRTSPAPPPANGPHDTRADGS